MNTNPFDREVRKKLENYESPVSDHLLDEVLKRRKRRAFLFRGSATSRLLLAALALLLISGTWYWLHIKEKPTVNTKEIPIKPHEDKPQAQLDAPSSPTHSAIKEQAEMAENITSNTSPDTNNEAKRATSPRSTKSASSGQVKIYKDHSSSALFLENPRETNPQTEEAYTNLDAGDKPSEKEFITADAVSLQKGEEPLLREDPSGEQSDIAFVPTALLPTLPKEHLRSDLRFRVKPECAKFRNTERRFYFDLLASPDVALRSIRPKEEQSAPLALKRLETETTKQSYTLGARFTTVSPHGWSLRSGFQYTQINERFAYEGETEERIIIKIIYNDQGQIIGTDTVYESFTPYYASNNVYRLFDIPLMAGYQIDLKHFALTFHGGLHFNLFLSPEGTFFSPEMQPVAFSEIPAFRKRASLSLAAAFGINYRLNHRIELLFEPRFRYFLSPFTTKDYLLEQQYMLVGLNLGARLRL